MPPPKPRLPLHQQLAELAKRNWVLTSIVSLLFVLAVGTSIAVNCCGRRKASAEEEYEDDDTSSPAFGSRTYGNVPLSEQAQRAAAARQAPRTFDNVPLSQQSKKDD